MTSDSHNRLVLHPTVATLDKLIAECDEIRTRRSGPGGQHRNKTESAVVLTHRPTGVTAEANERRSQHENRCVALNRLRLNLAIDFRGKFASQSAPSCLWSSRCTNRKIKVSASHEDFAVLLAEVLDQIFVAEFEVASAAEFLECSTSQLIKFLKTEPRALQLVNNKRAELGKHRLK